MEEVIGKYKNIPKENKSVYFDIYVNEPKKLLTQFIERL